MVLKSILCILVYSVCVKGFALPFEGLYRLDIIHYNDFHARFEETSILTPTCRFNNNSCLGGFPRLYHEVQTLLREKPDAVLLNAGDSFQGTYWYTLLKWNVTQQFMNLLPHDAHVETLLGETPDAVLLNAGDSFQGTYWYTLLKWNVTQQFMNLLPHDAHALGNHEFDDGPEGLAPYLKSLKAPVVAANMDSRLEPSLQDSYQPHVVVTRNGRRIGIIGLITPETAELASPGKVIFTNPGEATRREAKLLTEMGVDIILVLSHCGYDVDKEIARDYGENVDIIVGGHSHTLLWDGDSPSGEPVGGNYPTFVETSADNKHEVLIVQTSAFTKYMGNLSVYFDYKGDFVKWDGNAIFLNRSIEEDEEIKQRLEPYAVKVHEAMTTVVGETETTLLFQDCVYGECALGNLIVDGMVDHAKTKRYTKNYLSFIQRGNIKSSITEGNITQGEIFELLPYSTKVQVFELLGKYVLEALERSVSDAWAYHPFKGPWVLQVAGLKVVYNVSQPEGSRVTSVKVLRDDGSTDPLEPEDSYSIVMPSFLADGGDGFTMFKNKNSVATTIGRHTDILTTYIKKISPLKIKTEGRITIES